MEHLSTQELIIATVGMIMFWFFRFSSDKDEFDEKGDLSFSTFKWIKDWFTFKWDNIGCHIFATFFFLYLGQENLQNWLGELSEKLPMGVDEIGSAGSIGFFGSFIAEGIKKLLKFIKV
jgi:hypothetical protein